MEQTDANDKARIRVKFMWFSFENETLSVDENGEIQRGFTLPAH